MIRKRANIEFQLGKVAEIFSDRDLSITSAPEPYSAYLATRDMIEVTAVTPSDEQESEFASFILSTLLRCLRDKNTEPN
jgi:hypothetical protein